MNIGVDYIGMSAGAVIINDDGKYFLAKRGSKARDDVGKWEFPGGVIKFYESREDAVRRIIAEKHDFSIEIIKELGVYDVIDRANKDHWISTTFICQPVNGTPRIVNPEKCTEIGWFSFDELQKMDLSRITNLNVKHLQKESVSTPA
jgi:8-oxo-dGTP diphosphatase